MANIEFDAILETFSNLKIFSTQTVAICNLSCCEDSVKWNVLGLGILLGALHKHRNSHLSRKSDWVVELRRQAYSRKDLFSFFSVWGCSDLWKRTGPPRIHGLNGLLLSWDRNNCLSTGSGMVTKPVPLSFEQRQALNDLGKPLLPKLGLFGKENLFKIFSLQKYTCASGRQSGRGLCFRPSFCFTMRSFPQRRVAPLSPLFKGRILTSFPF